MKRIKIILCAVFILAASVFFCSCDDYSAEDLADAQSRDAAGEEISPEDEIMVDGFEDWEATSE